MIDEQQFLKACKDGDLGSVQRLKGSETLSVELVKKAMMNAIHNIHLEVIKYLIEECNAPLTDLENNYNDYKPICAAASLNNLELVKLLVENGANVNEIWDNECYPDEYAIQFAACKDSLDIVKYMISEGAKLDKASKGPYGSDVITSSILCSNEVGNYFLNGMSEYDLTKHFCWGIMQSFYQDDITNIIEIFTNAGAKLNSYVMSKIEKRASIEKISPKDMQKIVECIQTHLPEDVDITDLVLEARNVKPNEVFDLYDTQ